MHNLLKHNIMNVIIARVVLVPSYLRIYTVKHEMLVTILILLASN